MVENDIKLSAVLPCYNVELFIIECLESLLLQTFTKWEAVLVDDGSLDKTGEICDEYSQRDPRFVVIHTKNNGVSTARNKGINAARGEYIIFVDPDDLLLATTFETAYYQICKHNVDAVRFNYAVVDGSGNRLLSMNGSKKGLYDKNAIINELFPSYIGTSSMDVSSFGTPGFWDKREFGAVWRFIYRKSVLIENKVYFDEELKLNEDSMFNCKFFLYASSILIVDNILYIYFSRSTGSMSNVLTDIQKLVSNKLALVNVRKNIVIKMNDKYGKDFFFLYAGSLFLSALEIIVKASYSLSNWKYVRCYLSNHDVKAAVTLCQPLSGNRKIIILSRLLKYRLGFLVFFLLCIFRKLGIKLAY